MALAGRVPVKISLENGEVRVGDRLTVSKTKPGYAMRQTEPGQSVGIALESSEAAKEDKILVFLNLSYWTPDINALLTQTEQEEVASGSNQGTYADTLLKIIVNRFSALLDIVFEEGLIKVARGIFEEIETKFIKSDYAEILKGITIYDEFTNQPYCLKIQNGTTVTSSGKCPNQVSPTPEATLSPTPEATPAPEVTPEPTSEGAPSSPDSGSSETQSPTTTPETTPPPEE